MNTQEQNNSNTTNNPAPTVPVLNIPTKVDENGREDVEFTNNFLNKIPSIHKLREKYRVRVVHRRFYHNFPHPLTKEQASGISMVMDLGGVYPRGGLTEVYIHKNEKILRGFSICHSNDNFNKRKAVKYAVYRALNGDLKEWNK